MQVQDIQAKLAQGSKLVTFTKKDGTVSTRWLTLDPDLIPHFEPKTDRVTRQSVDTVRVWDVTNEKFISLIPGNVAPF